jgi:hypothetical protein
MTRDIFDAYEDGVHRFLTDLENELGISDPVYQDVLNLQSQLYENSYEARQFSDNAVLESQRNRILYELNRICLKKLGKSFNQYYLVDTGKGKYKTRHYEENLSFVDNTATYTENEDPIEEIAQECIERGFSPRGSKKSNSISERDYRFKNNGN